MVNVLHGQPAADRMHCNCRRGNTAHEQGTPQPPDAEQGSMPPAMLPAVHAPCSLPAALLRVLAECAGGSFSAASTFS